VLNDPTDCPHGLNSVLVSFASISAENGAAKAAAKGNNPYWGAEASGVTEASYCMPAARPLKAYFDETGTHKGAPLVCVAGYLFDNDAANKFEALHAARVKPLLPVSAQGIFHAAKCFGRHGEFDSLSPTESTNIFDAMIEVLRSTMMYGMLTQIETAVYKRLDPEVRKMVGSAYSICAIRCAENVAEWLTKNGIAGNLQYFFEAGCQYAGEATHFCKQIESTPELKSRFRLCGYSFVPKRAAPQLQAADLLAWEWQREWATLTVSENRHRERRPTLKRLADKEHPHQWEPLSNIGALAIVNSFYGLRSNRSK
jgi:Protein of unknown function (DUF3800)